MSVLALIEKRRKAAKEIPEIENILRGMEKISRINIELVPA